MWRTLHVCCMWGGWGWQLSTNFRSLFMTQLKITCQQVADKLRIQLSADLFGIRFPLNIEPAIYSIASNIAEQYNGSYWEFYSLSNGGFYMAPFTENTY